MGCCIKFDLIRTAKFVYLSHKKHALTFYDLKNEPISDNPRSSFSIVFNCWTSFLATLIKRKIKFSSYIRKFRVERLQIIWCMRKGFLIFEEMHKYLVIYEESVSHIWLCNRSLLDFLIYEENIVSLFSVYCPQSRQSAKLFLQSSELGLPHPLVLPNLWSGGGGHTRLRERG